MISGSFGNALGKERDNERLKPAQGCSMDRARLVMPICRRAASHLMELPATFGSAQSLGNRHILCYSACMSATPVSQGMPAVPHKDPRGRRRPVGYDRAAPLKPIDLEAHKQLLGAHQIMSGRCRGYVYWWRKGRLHWRRHVIPRDPRTPRQRRSRAAFGKAAKAWSQNQPLTQAQRDAWYAAAAKIKSQPRLGTSGFLKAPQHFVGSNALEERWGLPLLLEPPDGGRKYAEGSRQNTKPSAKVQQPQRLVLPACETCRACAVAAPSQHRAAKGGTGRPNHPRVTTQLLHCQSLTPPSSERPHSSSLSLPEQRRWQARSPHPAGAIALPRWSSTLARISQHAHFRQLWRGS